MKKLQKLGIILMIIIIPIIIIAVSLIVGGISIKDIPLLAIIGVSALILISPFTFLLAQRSAQRTYNATLQKQKKRLLTMFGIYIFFSAILLIVVLYYVSYQYFWVVFLAQILPPIFFMFFGNFRFFFPKEKKQKQIDEIEKE